MIYLSFNYIYESWKHYQTMGFFFFALNIQLCSLKLHKWKIIYYTYLDI